MSLKSLAVIALVGAASVAGPVLADIYDYDSNGDGAVSREEFTAIQTNLFHRLDADGNGSLTQAEVTANAAVLGRRGNAKRILARDTDGDGAVSEAEFVQASGGFDRADRNGDGTLSGAELARLDRVMERFAG